MPSKLLTVDGVRKFDVVYVASHLSDTACSCPAHIHQQRADGKKVLVVSIFTNERASVAGGQGGGLHEKLMSDSEASTCVEEDAECMRALDVDWHYAGFTEFASRHDAPRSRALFSYFCFSFGQNRVLIWQIAQYIRKILTATGASWLVGPAAIGLDPDSLIVYRACCQVKDSVRTWFHYDFPYASYRSYRWSRLAMLEWQQVRKMELRAAGPETLDLRKSIVARYGSSPPGAELLGSPGAAGRLLDQHPQERFLQHPRMSSGKREYFEDVNDSCNIVETVVGTTWVVSIVVFDCIMSFLAYIWCKRVMDGGDDDIVSQSQRFVMYIVIVLSFLRSYFLTNQHVTMSFRWFCVFCVVLIASALGAAAWQPITDRTSKRDQLKELLMLCVYYSFQMGVGIVEMVLGGRTAEQASVAPKQEMKILMVTDYMPPQTHGISTHSSGLLEALRAAGHRCVVYTTCGEESEDHHVMCSLTNPWNPGVRLCIFPSPSLLWHIVAERWDVIHVICPNLAMWPVLLVAWLAGRPTYCSHHVREDIAWSYIPWRIVAYVMIASYAIYCLIPCYLFSTMNAALTYGYIRNHHILNKIASRRLAIAPSSIDASKFRSDREDRAAARRDLCGSCGVAETATIWLVVSRLAPEKDLQEVIKAIAYQRETYPDEDVHLVMAGDGPTRAELEKEAQEKHLPVHFLGMMPHHQTPSLYIAADVCLTCSVKETFGLTVLEALACGAPKVMPHCEVFDELYAETLSEWMYVKGDPASLAETLRAASRPESRLKLQDMRERRAFGPDIFWSWADVAVEQAEHYRRALAISKGARRFFGFCTQVALMSASLVVAFMCTVRSIVPGARDLAFGDLQ